MMDNCGQILNALNEYMTLRMVVIMWLDRLLEVHFVNFQHQRTKELWLDPISSLRSPKRMAARSQRSCTNATTAVQTVTTAMMALDFIIADPERTVQKVQNKVLTWWHRTQIITNLSNAIGNRKKINTIITKLRSKALKTSCFAWANLRSISLTKLRSLPWRRWWKCGRTKKDLRKESSALEGVTGCHRYQSSTSPVTLWSMGPAATQLCHLIHICIWHYLT